MPLSPLRLARERGAEGGGRALFPPVDAVGYVLSPLTGLRNGHPQGESFIRELLTHDTNGASPQACPNYAPVAEERRAAAPLAVRKGCAFPLRESTNEPPPRRLEGIAFQAARRRREWVLMSRKGRAFPQSRGRSPLKRHDRSLIWTSLGFAPVLRACLKALSRCGNLTRLHQIFDFKISSGRAYLEPSGVRSPWKMTSGQRQSSDRAHCGTRFLRRSLAAQFRPVGPRSREHCPRRACRPGR